MRDGRGRADRRARSAVDVMATEDNRGPDPLPDDSDPVCMRINPALSSANGPPSSVNQTMIHSAAGAFHPDAGMQRTFAGGFDEEQRVYLRGRLRMATLVMLAGFLGFLALNLLLARTGPAMPPAPELPPPSERTSPPGDIPPSFGSIPAGLIEPAALAFHAAVTLLMAGLALALSSRWSPSLAALRGLEYLTFGVPATFFVWSQYNAAMSPLPLPPDLPIDLPPEFREHALPVIDAAWVSLTAIPWILLSQMYGVFIPNTWKRASIVVLTLCLAPIVLSLLIVAKRPEVRDNVLSHGNIFALTLWMTIAAVVAIYGSHRFGRLRKEAFDARSLGAYTLREMLGAGGMGEVYLAEHRLLKRPAAIKLIRTEKAGDTQAIARFEGEVQATAALTHPNTVEIYDYGRTDDGTFYYVMEFLPGLNLQDLVDRYGPLPAERVVHFLTQVCSALREAHRAGLIHRDIKPGNIFACERGGLFDVAKLLDFGLVKSVKPENDAQLTQDGAVVGSPLYAAPEAMIDEDVDARVDVYSLGATAYFLLTGRPVFEGSKPIKVIMAHQNDAVIPPSKRVEGMDIPADLEAVVLKCLEKKRDRRYHTVQHLEKALAACECAGKWTFEIAYEWWLSNEEVNLSVSDTAVNTATMTSQVSTPKPAEAARAM